MRKESMKARLMSGLLAVAAVAWGSLLVARVDAAQAARGTAKPAAAPAAANAPAAAETYRAVYNGWKWWHVYCYRCHGVNGLGATLAPDLLDPNRKMARTLWVRTVARGRDEKGMPEWASLLSAAQMNDLFVYVRARADKVLPAGRPDEVGTPRGKPWAPPAGWVAR
jgi:mono/diheme cytochrome c family protein